MVRGYQPLHQTRGLTSSINFLTMEQKFGTTTFWTSNSRRGGSLMEVRLRLGMLEMTLVKDKSSRTTIILFSCQWCSVSRQKSWYLRYFFCTTTTTTTTTAAVAAAAAATTTMGRSQVRAQHFSLRGWELLLLLLPPPWPWEGLRRALSTFHCVGGCWTWICFILKNYVIKIVSHTEWAKSRYAVYYIPYT